MQGVEGKSRELQELWRPEASGPPLPQDSAIHVSLKGTRAEGEYRLRLRCLDRPSWVTEDKEQTWTPGNESEALRVSCSEGVYGIELRGPEGLALFEVPVIVSRGAEVELNFEWPQTAALRVTVSDIRGVPLPNARIRIPTKSAKHLRGVRVEGANSPLAAGEWRAEEALSWAGFEACAEERTNEEGVAEFLAVPVGRDIELVVEAEGYVARVEPPAFLESSSEVRVLEVALVEGEAPIRGVVLRPDGKPCSGARICYFDPRRPWGQALFQDDPPPGALRSSLRTEASGGFVLFDPPATSVELYALAPGLGVARLQAEPGAKLRMELKPIAPTVLQVEAAEDGAGIENAFVACWAHTPVPVPLDIDDGQRVGQFRIQGGWPTRDLIVSCGAPGRGERREHFSKTAWGQEGLRIGLDPGASVRLSVRAAVGAPNSEREPYVLFASLDADGLWSKVFLPRTTAPAEGGWTVSFEGLPMGSYELMIKTAWCSEYRDRFDLDESSASLELERQLELLPIGAELSGQVVDSDGDPVGAVDITVEGTGLAHCTTRTRRDGSFKLLLPRGAELLRFNRAGFAERSVVPSSILKGDWKPTLSPSSRIDLWLRARSGSRDGYVRLLRSGKSGVVDSGYGPLLTFDGLDAGEYLLLLQSGSDSKLIATVDVEAGERVRVAYPAMDSGSDSLFSDS